jgi:hypothetical protein
MPAPHAALHSEIFRRICSTLRTLYLSWSFANVSVISLNTFKGVKVVGETIPENCYVRRPRRIGTFHPNQIPRNDVHPELVANTRFPFEFVRRPCVARCNGALLGDLAVSAIDADKAVVQTPTDFPALENNLGRLKVSLLVRIVK